MESAFQLWNRYEPNNTFGREDCLGVGVVAVFELSAGEWNDLDCATLNSFVCEVEAGVVVEGCDVTAADGKTFAVCAQPFTWDAARQFCIAAGGDLARVESMAQNAAIVVSADGLADDTPIYWLGGTDAAAERAWRWVDGTAFAIERFEEWAPGRPDDATGGEDCVQLTLGSGPLENRRWDDVDCALSRGVVCEVPDDAALVLPCERDGPVGNVPLYVSCGVAPYADAVPLCASMNGVLVREFTAAFHADLADYASARFAPALGIWLGADDVATEGAFRFIDGGAVP